VERRHDQRVEAEGERPKHDAWKGAADAHLEKHQQGRLWDKLRHHEAMIRAHTTTHEAIIARHRAEVERCEQLLGITDTKGQAA
jgi:hypothetical protein